MNLSIGGTIAIIGAVAARGIADHPGTEAGIGIGPRTMMYIDRA